MTTSTTTVLTEGAIDACELREERKGIIEKYGSEANRERFNNYKYLEFDLWSEHPTVDRLVTKLALRMWQKDHQKRHNHLKVILLNLMKVHGADPEKYLGYHRSNDFYNDLSRSNNPARISNLIAKVVDDLAKDRLVENHRGRYQVDARMGYVSKVRATQELVELLEIFGIITAMITKHPNIEVIVLKGPKDWTFRNDHLIKTSGQYLQYKDTPEVIAMRKRLEAYNRFMTGVELEYNNEIIPIGPTLRIFNESWDRGGRFYGGFWQNISKDHRGTIRLNDQPVIELDYGSLHTHLLYSRVGVQPNGDLYDIEGIPRSIAKHAVMLMIGTKRRSSVIRNLKVAIGGEEYCPGDVISALEDRHPMLAEQWYKGAALDLQNIDSQICDRVLTILTNEEVPCLGVHDSFVVPQQHKDWLRHVMTESFKEVTKQTYDPPIG